jgi:hypothetical protein
MYLKKIEGADDPVFPRAEVELQMKQTAMAMYTASEFICSQVCDVAPNSALILFVFSTGVQALIEETLTLLRIPYAQEHVDRITMNVLDDVNRTGRPEVSFTASDVESFVRNAAETYQIIRKAPTTRESSPRRPNMASPGPVPRPATPPARASVGSPGRPITPLRMTPGKSGSPARPGTPGSRVSSPRPNMDRVLVKNLVGYLVNVGTRESRSYFEAEQSVDRVCDILERALVQFKEERRNQRFSQSQFPV